MNDFIVTYNRWLISLFKGISSIYLGKVLLGGVILLLVLNSTDMLQVSEAQEDGRFALWEMVDDEQANEAVHELVRLAQQRGGFAPAPGDVVVFDPTMLDFRRASTIAIDQPPLDCEINDHHEPRLPDCDRDFQVHQNEVRLGMTTFADPFPGGGYMPRALDDILSVYIEEVGHSWQEYCFETDGRCDGERTRITTWGEGKALAVGWEFQIKMYILSLDGSVLHLSGMEQVELMNHICNGYANPKYATISPFGPPPGWINPEGWLVTNPTDDELDAFCENY